jgi:CRISPR-associated protein Cas1
MIKRTIVVSNPAFLKKQDEQLVIKRENDQEDSVPIEDIGVLVLESYQVTITQPVLSALMANGAVVITCDSSHHPNGIMLPVSGNALHTMVLRNQLQASRPFRKRLWQQTVRAKIINQADLLERFDENPTPLRRWVTQVRSGDSSNIEARAARYYWEHFLPAEMGFQRNPEGSPPNNLLNYGYAILRAAVARALVSSGLHPAVGIHHRNEYNAFCLADDVMEPYRPFVDWLVRSIVVEGEPLHELTPSLKKRLLSILAVDVEIDKQTRPLQLALSTTTKSLADCYAKERRVLKYPRLPVQSVSSHVESGVF